MGVLPAANFLSWNSARLLALLLNSLTGLVQFLQKEPPQNVANLDALLPIRLIQESLWALDNNFRGRSGLNPGIFQAIRNLSGQIGQMGTSGRELAQKVDAEMFKKFGPILTPKLGSEFAGHKLLDERLRWREKGQQEEEEEVKQQEEHLWMDNEVQRCVGALLDCCNCTLPAECSLKLAAVGQIGFNLTRQLRMFILLEEQAQKCPANDGIFGNSTGYLAVRCANMWDELNEIAGRKKRKQLARMQIGTLSLLADQAYLCGGHQGYVQFANPHLLLALLSWQHPELGCWTATRADPVPEFGIKSAVEFQHLGRDKWPKKGEESRKEESCLVHASLVAGLALSALFLRLMIDPGPWPEQHGLSQLVQLDGVPAEDKFHAFPYLEWVHDSDIAPAAQGVRLLRPPSSSWSPDLIAFVCLLFFIVLGFVLFLHFCTDEGPPGRPRKGGPGQKKLYPYAFKKL